MTVVTMKIITNLGYVARLTPDTCWFMSAWSSVFAMLASDRSVP